MKPLPLLLAASLVANAALVTVTLRGPSSPSSSDSPSASSPGSSASPSKPSSSSPTSPSSVTIPPDLVAALNANDPQSLRDLLRAAGLNDDMVRSLVQMHIWKKYEARFKALNPRNNPDPNKPWWRDDRSQQNGFAQTKEQREESRRLQREIREETERLLGPDTNSNRWNDQRLSFLSPEKREALKYIQQDYQDIRSEIQQEMQGFRLPSDAEKLRFLQEEQKRDIEALMTPEERVAYDLRLSPTAANLRWEMTCLDVSESEYLKIFALQKNFDDKYPSGGDPFSPGYNPDQPKPSWSYEERDKAEQALRQQIKSLIGEDRYARAAREQDYEYRQLQSAARRFELPADTPDRIYALRDTVSASARLIADHPSLSPENKKQEMARLAAQTRDQVRSRLGTDIADAYFKNNGMGWLTFLDEGTAVTFSSYECGGSPYNPAPSVPASPGVPVIQVTP